MQSSVKYTQDKVACVLVSEYQLVGVLKEEKLI